MLFLMTEILYRIRKSEYNLVLTCSYSFYSFEIVAVANRGQFVVVTKGSTPILSLLVCESFGTVYLVPFFIASILCEAI